MAADLKNWGAERMYSADLNGMFEYLLDNDLQNTFDAIEAGNYTSEQSSFYYQWWKTTSPVNDDGDQTNSTALTKYTGSIVFCQILDTCDDSSVDSSIWNTSTSAGATGTGQDVSVSENGTYLECTNNMVNLSTNGTDIATAITSGASGFDGRALSGNSEVIVLMYAACGDAGRKLGNGYLQISNGSTHVNIKYWDGASTSVTPTMYRIVINKSGETCDVYENDSLLTNDLNISSVTTHWYIRISNQTQWINAPGSTSGNFLRCYGIGWHDGSAASSLFRNTAVTTASNDTSFVKCHTWDVEPSDTSTDVVLSYSTDGGSSFGDAVTQNGALVAAAGSGTSSVWKIDVTLPTSISATTKNCPTLSKWGAYHG